MSGRLTKEHKKQLEIWIGKGKRNFELIFSLTKDGGTAQAFHDKCNNQGPTVTVVYNDHNSIYGGYASQSWNRTNAHITDAEAFLYQLEYSRDVKRNKFPVKNAQKALYCHTNYGPVFGSNSAPDMWTYNTAVFENGIFKICGDMIGFETNYDSIGVKAADVNNGSSRVVDIEVYRVTEGQPCKIRPWRKINIWDAKKLQESISKVKPVSGLDVREFRFAVFGPVGGGKSSYINTVMSSFADRITQRAAMGVHDENYSTTNTYTGYSVGSASIRLYDTPGFTDMSGLDLIHINYILDGHVADNYVFHPTVHITRRSDKFIRDPSMDTSIHCGIFVLDATEANDKPELLLRKTKTLMNEKKIPVIVLLSKIDKLDEDMADYLKSTFENFAIKELVDKVATSLGVARNCIYPVKNYENEVDPDEDVNVLALLAMRQAVHLAEDFMRNALESKSREQEVVRTTESDTA